MSKFQVEYKIIFKDEGGSEVRHFKKIIDQGAVNSVISELSSQEGIEFFTLRKYQEPKQKVQSQAKKEIK